MSDLTPQRCGHGRDAEACTEFDRLRDALEAAEKRLLDVHDALHRQCSGDVDLPGEIRALRANLEAAERQAAHAEGAAELLVGAEEENQATARVLREACGGSEPSAGHTLAEEVAGLLHVARSQRDAADAASAALRERVSVLAKEWEDEATRRERYAVDPGHDSKALRLGASFERNHAERLRALVPAPGSDPGATTATKEE